MTKRGLCAIVVGVALAACGTPPDQTIDEATEGMRVVRGNPTCASLGLAEFQYKVDPPTSGTYSFTDGINSVTISTPDGIYFDWTATLGIDAVIVKGGNNANVYTYDPEALSDTGLHAPDNPNGRLPYALSHISFCYDYEVMVTKTASPAFDRTWSWDVTKSVRETAVTLATGEVRAMEYSVSVNATGYTDSNWSATGTIDIYNPAPYDATITGVTDVVGGAIPATVTCSQPLPYVLAPAATLTCSYTVALPDGSTRVNEASVSTTGPVGPNSGTATVDFASAAINGIDECVTVDDDKYGTLGQVCAAAAPHVFNYMLDIGPYAVCGTYTFTNTATIVTNDTQSTDSDSATVDVEVLCGGGCTLTPGYWKTHSEYGPAPYDDTWAQLANGADTAFFLSGQSFHEVLWTAPRGNAYYILAHAYIAAWLNEINGADLSAASQAFNDATPLFNTYTPADVAAVGGSSPVREAFISLAETLDDYNNGLIGPGHCTD